MTHRRSCSRARITTIAFFSMLAITTSYATAAQGHPGDLDPSFGGDGIVTTRLGATRTVHAIAVQSSGRIIAAGGGRVVRYLSNGRRDPTFGGRNGVLGRPVAALALQPDGRIIIASGNAIERFHTDGTLGPEHFGEFGVVRVPNVRLGALAIRRDGKIIAGGRNIVDGGFALVRLLPNGAFDPSFGGNGIVSTNIGGRSGETNADAIHSLALLPGSRIIAAGRVGTADGSGCTGHCAGPYVEAAVARYLPGGQLDPTYGDGGIFTTTLAGDASSMALRRRGRIVFSAGEPSALTGGPAGTALIALTPGGRLDTSFSGDGVATLKLGGVSQVVVQQSGRIVAAGGASAPSRFLLARYRVNGRLDRTFGGDGVVTTLTGSRHASEGSGANALALAPHDRIVAAGGALVPPDYNRFAIARYFGGLERRR